MKRRAIDVIEKAYSNRRGVRMARGRSVFQQTLSYVLLSAAAACGPVEETDQRYMPQQSDNSIGQLGEPLGAQQIVATAAGQTLTEPYAFITRSNSDGSQETIATSNSTAGALTYGCTRDNYSTWRTFSITDSAYGGDSSGYFRLNTNTFNYETLVTSLASGTSGIHLLGTFEPCPTTGSPGWFPWTFNAFPGNNTVDYPFGIYVNQTDERYVTYTQVVNGHRAFYLIRIHEDLSFPDIWPNVPADLGTHGVNWITSATDSAGNIHFVFADFTAMNIRHTMFNISTHQFTGTNQVIGPYSYPNGSCGACPGIFTYTGLQSNCIRSNPSPSIDIDTASNPNSIVVAYTSAGTSAHCSGNQLSATYFYRSTNGGSTWTSAGQTACNSNSIFTRVAAARQIYVGGIAGNFHVVSSYADIGVTKLSQVDWKSTNGGQFWSGVYITGQRTTVPTGGCYMGDYQGAAADMLTNQFFYNWGELPSGASNWVIKGITNNP